MLTRLLKALPLGVLVAIIGLVISYFQFAHELEEDVGLGLLFKLRGPRPAPSDAVVVSIDKDSAARLGIPSNPDKWPRSLHARLVDVLYKAGAAVVTFDVHFLESRVAEDDKLFAQAISRAGNVVLCDPILTREIAADNGPHGQEHNIYEI
jgi:adenylate cyclase